MVDDSTFLSVIRVWAALAWADGVVVEAESEAMKRLIAGASLSDEGKATAHGYLESPVELEAGELSELSDAVREGIYRAAYRLAKVDLEIAVEERDFLARLKQQLKLTEEACAEIEGSVDGRA